MNDRRQQKLGWILGWLGGFVWVLILSCIFAVQGKMLAASLGLLLFGLACLAIIRLSPWRFPRLRFRLLMLPIYILFLTSLAWGVWAMEDPQKMGIHGWWSAFVLLPILLPFWTAGNQRWDQTAP